MKPISKSEILRFKRPIKKSWWIPLWKGLVFDPVSKHRLQMGSSIWVYLYLLFSVNRKNATVTKKQQKMAGDVGLSVRTVQKHLSRLKKYGYIISDNARPAQIKITKWKLFNEHKNDDG